MKKVLLAGLVVGSLMFANDVNNSVVNNVNSVDETSKNQEVAVINQQEVNEQNKLSDVSMQDITPKSLDEYFEEFKNDFGVAEFGQSIYGKDGGVKTFYVGRAISPKTPLDPNFVKHLQMTYTKALMDMQKSYIEDTFGQVSNKLVRRMYNDENKEFEPLPSKSKFIQLWNKILQLGDAQIDEKLRSLGVEPNESFDLVRKKELFADTISQEIVKSAVGNIKGLVPVRTIVTVEDGAYKVGVIAVMSSKTIQLANDMKYKRSSVFKGKGKALSEFLPKDTSKLINEFGIRMVYDENGEPMILSYAQWGVFKDKNPAKFASKKQIAKDKAKAMADAQISDFINSHITSKSQEKQASNMSTTLTQTIKGNDESLSEEEVEGMIDSSNTLVTLTSNTKLLGIRTVKSWEHKDENGHHHLGVVRFYKYSNVQDTKNMLNANKNKAVHVKTKVKNATSASKVVNDIDDF